MPLTFGVQDRGVQSRRDCINQPRVARNELPLRLSRKIVAAHRSWRFCFGRSLKPDDLHHVIKPGIADPRTLETCRPITLAMEVTAQLSDDDQGCSEGEFISSFFLANNWALHIHRGQKEARMAGREIPDPAASTT